MPTNEKGARSSQCLHGTSPRFPTTNNQLDALIKRADQHTAAVSTPVGPPPQTTKLRSLRRSSSVAMGEDAASKLSGAFKSQSAHGPQIHRLMNKLTYNPAANVLCVLDRLELEAVLETRDAVLRRDGATGNDEFVVPTMQREVERRNISTPCMLHVCSRNIDVSLFTHHVDFDLE